VGPCSLVDVYAHSKERAASIFRVEEYASTLIDRFKAEKLKESKGNQFLGRPAHSLVTPTELSRAEGKRLSQLTSTWKPDEKDVCL
jgi:hypothetical protein